VTPPVQKLKTAARLATLNGDHSVEAGQLNEGGSSYYVVVRADGPDVRVSVAEANDLSVKQLRDLIRGRMGVL